MNYNYKTKKDIIIENAYRDPFLKVEDLAQMADTTSKYVRTILSESNVSLMELRKDYARKIENKEYHMIDRVILNYLMKVPFISQENIIKTEGLLLNNPLDIRNIAERIQRQYIYQSYKYIVKKKCWGLSTVFLENDFLKVDKESLTIVNLLDILNKEISTKDISISNIEVVVDLSTEQVSNLLGMSNFCPILRIKQTISIKSKIVVVILVYFNARQVSFSLPHNGGMTINQKGFEE